MTVELLHNTPLWVVDKAISKCYDQSCNKNEPNLKRISNVIAVYKHDSTAEHLVYSFNIEGISRAVLQELARHRHASLTVKSTRFTLKELKSEESFINGKNNYSRAMKYVVFVDDAATNGAIIDALENLRLIIKLNVKNDISKYALPEAYKTSLVWTVNARSLMNFLSLRTDAHALQEIRNLAYAIYDELPEDQKFLFKGVIYDRSGIK